jgi:hypothetical protein
VTPVLVLLALLSGCALVDGAADLTNRAVAGAAGRETTPVGDPLSFHLQLALLSDRVVTQIVQEAETPLDAVDDPNRRAALLRLRLGYASAMWNAASGLGVDSSDPRTPWRAHPATHPRAPANPPTERICPRRGPLSDRPITARPVRRIHCVLTSRIEIPILPLPGLNALVSSTRHIQPFSRPAYCQAPHAWDRPILHVPVTKGESR